EWSISARESGADVRYVAIVRDISERTAMEQRLYRQANFDDLTGLPNRTFLHEYLDGVLTSDHRFERFSGVLLANIDDFRAVQDSLGLAVGDSALVIVADRLRACAGPDDIVARFTGDSFAIVCMNPTQDVTAVGEAVVKAFDDPCDLGPNQIVLSVSAGVAADDGSRSTAADFLRDAGAAMNRAKQLGRSRVQVYDTQIRSMAIERFDIDTALHGALAARELFLVYQHIVDLQSGNVVGAEALLRWDRPGHGVVSPIVFVPRLEATGLIVDVGRWVLGQACADLATWQGRAQPGEARHSMSINVANRQLANGDFPDIVAATISDNDLAAEDIVLEVTESEFFDAHAPGSASIEELKRVGVRVAIDDFGTGYSSLSQMRSMRVDEIKIDKAFVDPIVDDSVGAAVVRTVARLGNHLGLTVVAEGVESAEQATLLRGMGCHLAQGYYFARPERAETSLGA
ncbi:MAG: bifunctional diguanylate cyclase/phosphodiesterase, partial [Candidatus Nanopelagicales bacterium]|nr:bifunctional diguanylate cyclase/phosphodiesterase [Candidatus Nanopelagicales bacterium]